MDHDYAHCADYDSNSCPKVCFRGELVRDLVNLPSNYPVTYIHLKDTEDCMLNIKT